MNETKHQAAEEQGRSAMRDFWEKTAPTRDEVAKQTRAAVDDIRIKVVEEGWTGKAQTTPAQEVRSTDLYGHSQSNEPEISDPDQSSAADLYGPDDLSRDDPSMDDPEQDGPDMER